MVSLEDFLVTLRYTHPWLLVVGTEFARHESLVKEFLLTWLSVPGFESLHNCAQDLVAAQVLSPNGVSPGRGSTVSSHHPQGEQALLWVSSHQGGKAPTCL